MLTHARLLELVHYDPETGVFTWKVGGAGRGVGKRIGSLTPHGYLRGKIGGRLYMLHQVAWFYVTGRWPERLDHRNRIKTDNRWRNLREATRRQNAINTKFVRGKTGLKGAFELSPRKDGRRRFRAYATGDSGPIHLGIFDTAEAAHAAYVRATKAMHGEFAEHLSPLPAGEASGAS